MHRPSSAYPNIVSTTSSSQRTHRRQGQSDDGIFLEILHRLLDESEGTDGNVISWSTDGLSFQVHDIRRFEHYLMPVYFGENSSYCSSAQQHEPLKTYGSFLRRLRSYDFHRIFIEGILKETCSHPLFVRGKKHMVKNMTCHEDTPLTWRRWPIPLSPNPRSPPNTDKSKDDRRQPKKGKKPRACRTSISNLKKRHQALIRRINTYSQHPTDPRFSLKEAQLQRKPPTCGSQERQDYSISELLSDVPFPENSGYDSPDDFEPLSLSATCNIALDLIDLTDIEENAPSTIRHQNCLTPTDIEPLDPVCLDGDDALHGDIAEALARI